uniref:Uncharacterized protein n=1 Tax=Homalodisca liturata TaxID=320908 RepID=A0A1B6JAT3_9HEMI
MNNLLFLMCAFEFVIFTTSHSSDLKSLKTYSRSKDTEDDSSSNAAIFLDRLRQIYSHTCNLVNLLNTTQASDDDSFTTKMFQLAGEMLGVQKALRRLNVDEFHLRTDLNMNDDQVDQAKHYYFSTHRLVSMFITPNL